jgi:hypothetical protein
MNSYSRLSTWELGRHYLLKAASSASSPAMHWVAWLSFNRQRRSGAAIPMAFESWPMAALGTLSWDSPPMTQKWR